MDAVSMSLDDIIRKKKVNTQRIGGGFRKNNIKQRPPNRPKQQQQQQQQQHQKYRVAKSRPKPIVDARNKIIERNRMKIRDAREKLIQISKRGGDARLRLMRKMPAPRSGPPPPPPPSSSSAPLKSMKKSRMPSAAPYYYAPEDDLMMDMDLDEYEADYMAPSSVVLRRTVKNDLAIPKLPPLPTFSRPDILRRESPVMWSSDPFDCYEVAVGRPADVSEPKHLQRSVRNMNAELLPRKGILRNPREKSPTPTYRPSDDSSLSYEMRNRLERPPDANVSMGIFSNPYASKSHPSNGYRIVVSNLHSSVSQSDIKELFEDIGELLEARLVRPGVAEVIFDSLKDAETAVEAYHNRQLDGQPMKCLLVNPRSSGSKTTAPPSISSMSSGMGSGGQASGSLSARSSRTTNPSISSLEIDIDALHKVLFRRK